jgi:predicted enzyme related to lactoylglutathione lyase
MGERSSHPPGAFSWADLSTTDPEAAKAFYTALFGWETDDQPVPGGAVYTMLSLDGRSVAALSAVQQEGQPPAWNSYVTVESADAAASAAADAGGTVVMEPFDVMDAGRMAVVQDPTGAFFSVWEPRENIGAQFVNAPSALTINQLNTSDPERAQEFYAALFGWRIEPVEGGPVAYWGIYNGDRLNAGMMALPDEGGAPSHWLVYFGSEDVDDDADRIGELGGTVMAPPMSVPGGRILVASDPQGAVFALISGRFDD